MGHHKRTTNRPSARILNIEHACQSSAYTSNTPETCTLSHWTTCATTLWESHCSTSVAAAISMRGTLQALCFLQLSCSTLRDATALQKCRSSSHESAAGITALSLSPAAHKEPHRRHRSPCELQHCRAGPGIRAHTKVMDGMCFF